MVIIDFPFLSNGLKDVIVQTIFSWLWTKQNSVCEKYIFSKYPWKCIFSFIMFVLKEWIALGAWNKRLFDPLRLWKINAFWLLVTGLITSLQQPDQHLFCRSGMWSVCTKGVPFSTKWSSVPFYYFLHNIMEICRYDHICSVWKEGIFICFELKAFGNKQKENFDINRVTVIYFQHQAQFFLSFWLKTKGKFWYQSC